jgi:UDP:flavonoid glycosyltransferase YjiC (YdhE family)
MKLVVAAYGSRGDVEPGIAVGRELLRRGHDVRLAVTVPPDMLALIESAGLTAVPYGPDWQAQLRDEDFVRMIQNPLSAIGEAIDYVTQVSAEKSATLMSLTNGRGWPPTSRSTTGFRWRHCIPFRRRFWRSVRRTGA